MSRRLHIMSPSDERPPASEGASDGASEGASEGTYDRTSDPGQAGAHDAVPGTGPSLEAAALAGHAPAWAALIARDNHRVVVALLARGVPLDQARELAQETWLRLMQRQRTGRLSELSLPGLAIVQAGFLAANDRRRPRTWPAEAAPLTVSRRTLEDDAMDRQRLEVLGQALADCPPAARRVFEQVYDHPELSYAQVAGRVGLSVQRVKQIVFEVRKRLRAVLEREEQGR